MSNVFATQSKHLPSNINDLLQNKFHFPENILIGQVATTTPDGPWQRSLRIYGIEENLGFVLLTHVGSRKWLQLQKNDILSICLLSQDYRVQLSARCNAQLITKEYDEALFNTYWAMVRDDVKTSYQESDESYPSGPSSTFGMIAALPNYWESLVLEEDYTKSIRYKYEPTDTDSGWLQTGFPLY